MATATAPVRALDNSNRRLPGRRYDHIFFTSMAVAVLLTVFLGFAKTYFLAGVFRAPLPARIIHVHGALFSSWILLLIAQTALVSARRVDIHRKLGLSGFVLACAMVTTGLMAGTNALARGFAPPGIDPKTFYVVPIGDMLIFATLIAFAYRKRNDPAAHKRLIMIATTGLMIAAVARWPFAGVLGNVLVATLVTYVFLVALVAYDLWSTRKLHQVTIWASVFLVAVQWLRVPLGQTAAWHSFATWVLTVAR